MLQDSEEEHPEIPRVILFFNIQEKYSEESNQDLIIALQKEAENSVQAEELLFTWEEAGLSYEIRLVEDEEALLEKREMVTATTPREDTMWVEKWEGGKGNQGRRFAAFAVMGRSGEFVDIVDDTHLIGMSNV